jgi:ribosomal protein S17E
MGLNEKYQSGDILIPNKWSTLNTKECNWTASGLDDGCSTLKNHFTKEIFTKVFQDNKRTKKCSEITDYSSKKVKINFGGHIAVIDKIYEPTTKELFRVVN